MDIVAIANLVSSVGMLFLSVVMARETKRLRQAETEPDVSLHLDVNRSDYWFIELVLKNNGRGTAHDLTFDFKDQRLPIPTTVTLIDGNRELHMLSDISLLSNLSSLSPGQELRCHFLEVTAATEKFASNVTLSYKSSSGKSYKQEWVLDMKPYTRMKHNVTELLKIRWVLESIRDLYSGKQHVANGGSEYSNVANS